MEVITNVAIIVFVVICFATIIRSCAINSLGELRYSLRCAKKRYELFPCEYEAENIKQIETEIENFWGKKLVKESDKSIFDFL